MARRYHHTISTGFSSGARNGRKIGIMLAGRTSLAVVCHPAPVEQENGVGASGDMAGYHQDEAAWRRCRHTARPAPRRLRGPDRWHQRDRRSHSAGRPAGGVWTRVWPIGGRGHSSGRSEPRPGTRFQAVFLLAGRRDGRSESACLSGPASTRATRSAFWPSDRRGDGGHSSMHPGGPSGPALLNRWTQSRSVWRSMPPTRAASSRLIPSSTAASDNSRRL